MIILTKKKILFNFGIIMMFIFAFLVTGYNINNTAKKEVEAVQTVALPVDSKVIVIDAGHRSSGRRSRKQ